jgi:hypothetical protein
MFAENRLLLSVVRGHYKCLSQLVGVAAHLKHTAQPPTMGQSFIMTLYLLVFTASTAVIKGLLRNLLRTVLSSSAVDVLGLPEPWRLSIVSYFVSIEGPSKSQLGTFLFVQELLF